MSDAGPWILWVDGVGGYLVCAGDRVTLGQGFAESPADVALLADVSRRHAVIRRDGEGYWLEAERPARVNQTPVERALLKNDDRISLGESCQLQFTRPEPLSASARLTMMSGHRFAEPVDAVLLMAETLVLSRAPQAHVVVPDFTGRVILSRQPSGLSVRATVAICIGTQTLRDRAPLEIGVPILVEDVSLTLERITSEK